MKEVVWMGGPKDSVIRRPIPIGGGDIVCVAPVGYHASMQEWPKNKQLILAAPDMFNALLDLQGMEHHITDPGLRAKFVDRVYSAIEKAIG